MNIQAINRLLTVMLIITFCIYGSSVEAGGSKYTDFSTQENPDANSYQHKRDAIRKSTVSEERQGHLNRMKKAYKGTYHEKESMVPEATLYSPECFVHGPDTLKVGEPGIFHSRTVKSYDSFDLQSAWDISTPANMNYDQRIIDTAKPFERRFQTDADPGDGVKRWSKGGPIKRWSEGNSGEPIVRWSDGGGDARWDTDDGKVRYEGQWETAESTKNEDGFCRAEYKFNKAGMVRIDTTPIIPGLDKVVACAPKYVQIVGDAAPTWIYWTDDFNDNSLDTDKWHTPVEDCFTFSESSASLNAQIDLMTGESTHFEDVIQSKCPNNYFTGDYFKVSVDVSSFTEDVSGAYLLYKYGASSWKSVEINETAGQVKYRWGTEGSWSYSTNLATDPYVLKIRKNGNNLEFWNDADSQWESESFVATNQTHPVYMGVLTNAAEETTENYYSGTGRIKGQNADYATARATSFTCAYDSDEVGQQATAVTKYVRRAYLDFNTSGIPDAMNITQANLRIYLWVKYGSGVVWDVDVFKGEWQSLLCDYREANYDLGLTAPKDVTVISDVGSQAEGTYHTSPNMDVSYINKTGHTKYILVSSRDRAGIAPASHSMEFCGVNDGIRRPRLSIKYYYRSGESSFDNFAIEAY